MIIPHISAFLEFSMAVGGLVGAAVFAMISILMMMAVTIVVVLVVLAAIFFVTRFIKRRLFAWSLSKLRRHVDSHDGLPPSVSEECPVCDDDPPDEPTTTLLGETWRAVRCQSCGHHYATLKGE